MRRGASGAGDRLPDLTRSIELSFAVVGRLPEQNHFWHGETLADVACFFIKRCVARGRARRARHAETWGRHMARALPRALRALFACAVRNSLSRTSLSCLFLLSGSATIRVGGD